MAVCLGDFGCAGSSPGYPEASASPGRSLHAFERDYWRREASASEPLPELAAGAVASEEFRLLADHIPTLCWIAKGDGYIVWYNRRWHEYCGTTADEMEGWGWQPVHDPEILPEVMERWTRSIATGEPFEMTFPLRGADGTFRPFLTRVQPVRDAGGSVRRWFGVNTEIASQLAAEQALRESEARLRMVLDASPGGFYAVDRDGTTTLVSRGLLRMIGFADDREAVGKKLHGIIHHSRADTTGHARNAIVHQGRLDPGVELLTKPFSYADLASRVRDVLDGR